MIKVLKCSATQVDSEGFKARLQGFAVRDCFLVLEPDNNVSLGLLVRQESNSSILDEAVRTGHGVLDIDGGRVSLPKSDPNFRPKAETYAFGTLAKRDIGGIYEGGYTRGSKSQTQDFGFHNTKGRFPSNLILQHTPSCTLEGTKKVKGSHLNHGSPGLGTHGIYGESKSRPCTGYASEDGTEEVANWICQPGCPVLEMDNQSGNRPSTLARLGVSGPNPSTSSYENKERRALHGGLNNPGSIVYGDQGGASRFFKQVQTDTELDDYVDSLIRKGK